MKEKIVLDNISVAGNFVAYSYHTSPNLDVYFTTKQMFIQYEEDVTNVPLSILSIPFVNTMAGLSWLSGAMLFVDEIDETYYESFRQLKRAYSELHSVQLKGLFVPSRIVKNEIRGLSGKSLLLFGGGVDCHTSFLRHRNEISHILNIYGWLKDVNEVNAVDESDKRTVGEYAASMGAEAVHVRSNFASQFNLSEIDKRLCGPVVGTSYWYGFLHPMAFLSIATALAWNHGVATLMIASSFTKDKADIRCASYITTDREFRFATQGRTIHDGFELSRQDKVRTIVEYQRQSGKPYRIQACSFNDHNCCECEKCFRTIAELVAENAKPQDFGFTDIQGSLKQHWQRIVSRDVALWGTAKEGYYYHLSAERMRENYTNIEDKEFVDWFLNLDFDKAKREGLKRYYRQNFFNILKRKLTEALSCAPRSCHSSPR